MEKVDYSYGRAARSMTVAAGDVSVPLKRVSAAAAYAALTGRFIKRFHLTQGVALG